MVVVIEAIAHRYALAFAVRKDICLIRRY